MSDLPTDDDIPRPDILDTSNDIFAEPQPESAEAPAEEAPAPEAAPAGPRLVVKRAGVETVEVFPFAPPAVIGRFDPEKGPIDIDLGPLPEGVYVSRKHAKITLEDDVYMLTDLGSSNGTYILRQDFERIESAEIKDGDEIALGNARFVFHVG